MKQIKNHLLVLFAFFAVSVLWAQNKSVDSLKGVLSKTQSDAERVGILNQISKEYLSNYPKEALIYAQKALELSKKQENFIQQGEALITIGNAQIVLGEYKKAILHFSDAQFLFESNIKTNPIEAQKGLAKSLGSIGVVFSEQSSFGKAMEYYSKSVSLYEQLNDKLKSAHLYNNIGVACQAQNKFSEALAYFEKAKIIQRKHKDAALGVTLTNIANCLTKQNQYQKAFAYFSEARPIIDESGDARALGEWYNSLGAWYREQNESDKAVVCWNNAIRVFQNIEDKFGVVDAYLYLGNLELEQKQSQLAIEYGEKASAFAQKTEVLEQIILSEKLLSDGYLQQNKSNSALEHYIKYSEAKERMTLENTQREIQEKELSMMLEKKDFVHQQELKQQELVLQKQKQQMVLIIAVLFLIMGILFLWYNRNQVKKNLTLQKELSVYEQKALHLQMNPHFIFNCLGSISSFIVQNGTDSALTYLAKFSKLMRLTLEYSKEALIPIDKEIESLQNYLELEKLRNNQKFEFSIIKESNIEDDVALPPLLIQPFVENAILHGILPADRKGNIVISFSIKNESLICMVEDNGIGILESIKANKKSLRAHKSMATDVTNKRLEMIATASKQRAGLQLKEIYNQEGKPGGTRAELILPLQYLG